MGEEEKKKRKMNQQDKKKGQNSPKEIYNMEEREREKGGGVKGGRERAGNDVYTDN